MRVRTLNRTASDWAHLLCQIFRVSDGRVERRIMFDVQTYLRRHDEIGARHVAIELAARAGKKLAIKRISDALELKQ